MDNVPISSKIWEETKLRKFCNCCNKSITRQNFTTHKNTEKHKRNSINYIRPNLLDNEQEMSFTYKDIKIVLDELIKNIDECLLKHGV